MIVKTVGSSGQISLGKEFAGRTVVVDNPEEGVWIVRTARVIPDDELWLHDEPARSKIEAGLAWAAETEATTTDLDEFEKDLHARWEARRRRDHDEWWSST